MSDRLFFVHVMKTGGTSFLYNLRAQFGPGEVYPDPELDRDTLAAYTSVPYLVGLSDERKNRTRAYCGHFPFAAVSLLPGPFISLTVLRDPVERTISYLKQCLDEPEFRGQSLDQVYDDPVQHWFAIWNWQVRTFALRADDDPLHVRNPVTIDDERLELAKRHLDQVDIVGLHDRYDDFEARVAQRFGWPPLALPPRRVSRRFIDVPASLRRRIATDNAADVEFYEYAHARHERTISS